MDEATARHWERLLRQKGHRAAACAYDTEGAVWEVFCTSPSLMHLDRHLTTRRHCLDLYTHGWT